jgi:hypothetical protein
MHPVRVSFFAIPMAVVLLVSPPRVSAQDAGDIAAYAALSFTPLGAFVPSPAPPSGARGSAFVFRYGTIDLGGDLAGSVHSFSIGGDFAMDRGRLGLTVGGTTCEDCDGSIMAGLDYTLSLSQSVVSVALRPAVGFSKPLEDDGTALTFGASLPLGVELSGTTGPIFIPYLVPGIGFGRLSGDEDSESGMRPMLGGGFAIAGRQSTFAVHLGFQKVFIDEGETTFGLGFSIGRSAP